MKAYLILGDGTVFEGERIGAKGTVMGEAVFNTSMNGFVEMLTDPAAKGAIVVQTFPMAGNYGVNESDAESEISAAGFVVRELCESGSNFRKTCELEEFLIKRKIAGIAGIDTRELTKKLQSGGAQNAMITDSASDMQDIIKKLAAFKRENCLDAVSCNPVTTGKGKRVVLWDLGAKNSLVSALNLRGCEVVRLSYKFTAEQVLKQSPAGVVIAGGGSPDGTKDIVEQIRILIGKKVPVMGVGLGHLLLCLAAGGKIKKLKTGHRGSNQPVKDLSTGRVYITTQNHGYVAVASSLDKEKAATSFVNANDKTCEGLEFNGLPVFSVQFEPMGETSFVLDRFVDSVCKV